MTAADLLLRLYPDAWRRRYGEEFAAVLEARPLGPLDVLDVIRGAVDAHRRLPDRDTQPAPALEPLTSDQVGGGAAIIGGILVVLGGMWSAVDPAESDVGIAFIFAAFVALLYAVVGLSAFQARAHPRLVWTACVVPAAGAILAIGGMLGAGITNDRLIGDLAAWHFAMIGLLSAVVGSVLFALATLRTGILDRRSAVLLAISAAVVAVAFGGAAAFALRLEAMLLLGTLAYGAGWIGLGRSAWSWRSVPARGA